MPRPVALAEYAMEASAGIRELRRATAPLFEAALRSGNHAAMTEAHALAATLRVAERQSKRIAGIADGLVFPAGLFEGEDAA